MQVVNNKHMMAALAADNFNEFLALENHYYNKQVKVIEDASHYESMFSQIEESGFAYGKILKSLVTVTEKINTNRICYFLPSLDSDLAHIELLHAILNESEKLNFEIFVAGFAQNKNCINSKLLTQLSDTGKIKILKLEYSHSGIVKFIQWFNTAGISQLIITSIPILLNTFTEVFGTEKVTWFSMKFELNCFSKLKNRISFCGKDPYTNHSKNVSWLRNPPAIVGKNLDWEINSNVQKPIKLISINREEKIRNQIFLDAVNKILTANQDAHFYWTGRNRDQTIENFFRKNNIHNRTHYLGWVDPEKIISEFDVFLDTPNLSGSIAAKAFASGMPVATFKNSQSWLDFYSEEFDNEIKKIGEPNGVKIILFNDVQQYVEHVSKLIQFRAYYLFASKIGWYLGEKYFKNVRLMSESHFGNIQKILQKSYAYEQNTF